MGSLAYVGKLLIILGVLMILAGLLMLGFGKLVPRLPGDIFIQRGNFTFYFPVVTSILVSIILTVILNLIFRR